MSALEIPFEFAKWRRDQLLKHVNKEPDNEFLQGEFRVWQDICILSCPGHIWELLKDSDSKYYCRICESIEDNQDYENEYNLLNYYIKSCDTCIHWDDTQEELICKYKNPELSEDEIEEYLEENGVDCPYWIGKEL